MKHLMALCLLAAMPWAAAAEKSPETPAIKRTRAAVAGLSQKLDIKFSIPFPAKLDIDPHLIQPIARLATTQGELFFTKPVVNPFDGQGTIECHLGPPDEKQFRHEHVYCFFSFDDRGDILHVGLLANDGWFTGANEDTHQIIREDDETAAAFLTRAFLEYHRRAVGCGDPEKALLYLSGAERITQAVCELRRSEEAPSYPATARP
jgi:hypothetical protein